MEASQAGTIRPRAPVVPIVPALVLCTLCLVIAFQTGHVWPLCLALALGATHRETDGRISRITLARVLINTALTGGFFDVLFGLPQGLPRDCFAPPPACVVPAHTVMPWPLVEGALAAYLALSRLSGVWGVAKNVAVAIVLASLVRDIASITLGR